MKWVLHPFAAAIARLLTRPHTPLHGPLLQQTAATRLLREMQQRSLGVEDGSEARRQLEALQGKQGELQASLLEMGATVDAHTAALEGIQATCAAVLKVWLGVFSVVGAAGGHR